MKLLFLVESDAGDLFLYTRSEVDGQIRICEQSGDELKISVIGKIKVYSIEKFEVEFYETKNECLLDHVTILVNKYFK